MLILMLAAAVCVCVLMLLHALLRQQSPRSASPPMAKGPASPEPNDAAVVFPGILQGISLPPASSASKPSKHAAGDRPAGGGHRRGLSWSGWSGSGRRGVVPAQGTGAADVLKAAGEGAPVAAPISRSAVAACVILVLSLVRSVGALTPYVRVCCLVL